MQIPLLIYSTNDIGNIFRLTIVGTSVHENSATYAARNATSILKPCESIRSCTLGYTM
jgi:hypothetical protein